MSLFAYRRKTAYLLLALACATAPVVATTAPAAAQAAKKAVKAKIAKGKFSVENKRDVTLVELTLTSKTARTPVVASVAKSLAPGKKVLGSLPKKGGCVYDISGSFDDESQLELASVDLCKDQTLNLVE